MPVEVLVAVLPNPGKEDRCMELIKMVAEEAKKTEPDTETYHAYTATGENAGETDYIVYMRVKDEAALAKRRELQHHQFIAKAIQEEDLLRKPMRYMKLNEFAGWHQH